MLDAFVVIRGTTLKVLKDTLNWQQIQAISIFVHLRIICGNTLETGKQ